MPYRSDPNFCPKGHPKTPENSYPRYDKPGSGETRCKPCALERSAEWQRRNGERRNAKKREAREPLRKGRYRPSQADHLRRFWSHVEKTETCWLWRSGIGRGGYGRFQIEGKLVLAHHWIYQALHGPIDPSLACDHLCRVRACVRPEHIELVSTQVNNDRRIMPRKTHCPAGHPYDEANTYVHDGGRHCIACNRIRQEEMLAAKRALRWARGTCRNGHAMTPENRIPHEGGGTRCKLCQYEAIARYQAKKKQK